MAELLTMASNRFAFKYGGTEYPLMKISGINVQAKTSGHGKPLASGSKAQMTRNTTSTGYYNNQDVTITAVIEDGNKKLWDAFKKGMPATYGGDGKWGTNFTDCSFDLFDADAKKIITYELKQCQIVSYEVSDFNVSGQDFLTETFTLNVESVHRKQ